MSYVPVSLPALDAALSSRKFVRASRGGEITYERAHRSCPGLKLVVYTSIAVGAEVSRPNGADAIRVCATYQPSRGPAQLREQGLVKVARVNRVTSEASIVERLLARCKKVALETQAMTARPCPRCSAPTYPDSGRCVDRACRTSN